MHCGILNIRLLLLFSFFLIQLNTVLAHSEITDSLTLLIENSSSNEQKGTWLNSLTWAYYEQENDSSYIYAQEAITFAKDHQLEEQLILGYLQLAEIYRSDKEFDLAEKQLQNTDQFIERGRYTQLEVLKELYKGNLAYSKKDFTLADSIYQNGLHLSLKNNKELNPQFYLNLSKTAQRFGEFEGAEKFLRLAVKSAKTLFDFKHELAAYNSLGVLFCRLQRFDDAKLYLEKSLSLANQQNDIRGKSRAYLNLGNMYYFKSYPTTAIEYYIKGAELKKTLGDEAGIAKINNNIGAIYKDQDRFEESLKYFQKSTNYYKEANDSIQLAESWINMATVKILQGKPEEGLGLIKQSIEILEISDADDVLMMANINLGFAYSEMGLQDKAIDILTIAMNSAENYNDYYSIVTINNLFGACYFHQGNYITALPYYEKSLEMAQEIGLVTEQKKALFGLYEAEQKLGHFERSLSLFEHYVALNDTLTNINATNRISELQEKYNNSQNEHEISNLNVENRAIKAENSLKSNQLYYSFLVLILGFMVLLLVIIFFYQRSKRQKKELKFEKENHSRRINSLLDQHEIGMLETEVITQQEERKKLAKDIHDNLGSYLTVLRFQHELTSTESSEIALKNHHKKTAALIEKACIELRSISHQLAVGEGVEFNLIPSIKQLISSIESTSQFSVEFNTFIDQASLTKIAERNLYKIIQELFSNVLKHAEASEVTLQINQSNEEVMVLMEDNGRGFNLTEPSSEGIGLKNIQQRVKQLNGRVEFNSQKDHGVSVVIVVPIEQSV